MTHAEELLSEKGKLRLDLAILTGEHEALLARIEAELKDWTRCAGTRQSISPAISASW